VTQTKARKSTAARRPAAKKAGAASNGHSLPPATDEELRAPERFEPTTPEAPTPEAAEPEVHNPYGEKAIFVFKPQSVKHPDDSTAPIVLPHISTLDADVEFFWELDQLDPMHQAFRYMQKAGVPRDIQRRVVRLPDDEMGRCLRNWFMGIVTPQGVGPPGEF
jgi:hypothetical protein